MPQLDGAGADLAVTAEEHDHSVQDIAGKYRQCNAASQSDGSRGFGPIEIRIVEFLKNDPMPAADALPGRPFPKRKVVCWLSARNSSWGPYKPSRHRSSFRPSVGTQISTIRMKVFKARSQDHRHH